MNGRAVTMRAKLLEEKGIFNAIFLLFMVTLGVIGIGAFRLVRSEGHSMTENYSSTRVNYAAAGGAYYGMRLLETGTFDERTAIQIGATTIHYDTSFSGGELHLKVTGSLDDYNNSLLIRMQPRNISDFAVYLQGAATNVFPKDSSDNIDMSLMDDNVPSMPAVDDSTLYAMSAAQGNDQTDPLFKPADGYGVSFYQADGVTPNVHHIYGDLEVIGGRTIYGIFVVDGSIEIAGNARVVGVVYVVNPMATLILGGGVPTGASITGGIISHGDLFGTGSHIDIKHDPDYMRTFGQWVGPIAGFRVLAWEYL